MITPNYENLRKELCIGKIISCRAHVINIEWKLEIVRYGKFSLLHLNIASLCAQDEFEDMLSILDLDFDVLGLMVTRIIKEQNPTYDILLLGMRNISYQQNQPKVVLRYTSIKILKVKNVLTDLEKNLYIPKKL